MTTNRTDIVTKGGSLGACAALALFCRIIDYKRREDHQVGVSATIDLRGRLGHVGSLDKKATHAHSGGLNLVVVSSWDQKALEAEEPPFKTMPEGEVRTYARSHFKGAEHHD